MAQITYYIYAYMKLSVSEKNKKISFSVPTGNFGDAYAGYLAKSKFNIPIRKLIVATNENDILNRFFRMGEYKKNKVKSTNTPSMDIQVASNFERLLYELLEADSDRLSKVMTHFEINNKLNLLNNFNKEVLNSFISYKISEKGTEDTIKKMYKKHNIILDPHTAIGCGAALEYLKAYKNDIVISLATAHPAKFSESVNRAIKIHPILPQKYKNIFNMEEKFKVLENEYDKVKDYIFKNSLI